MSEDQYEKEAAELRSEVERLHDALLSRDTWIGKTQAMVDAQTCEIAALRAQLELTQTALGQSQADLMGCRDGALVHDLRAQLIDAHKQVEKCQAFRNEVDEW